MNAGDVIAYECPCCTGVLFRTVAVDGGNGSGFWAREKGSGEIKTDAEGDFMKCPQCSKRVALERVPAEPSGLGFQVSAVQKCDRILP